MFGSVSCIVFVWKKLKVINNSVLLAEPHSSFTFVSAMSILCLPM
jgi:hypothetical protein